MRMKDKVAFVVGSTSGIGKAMAEVFAKEGATVIVTGRREEKGQEVVKGIEEKGGKAEFYKLDVNNAANRQEVIDAIVAKYGKIDSFVYNSGMSRTVYFNNATEEAWRETLTTNLESAFFMARQVYPALKESKGNMLFTSSAGGVSVRTVNGSYAYAASKAGLNTIVKILALELAKDGIRVNAIAPGMTKTDILANASEAALNYMASIIPLQYIAEPEDIANVALTIASDEGRFMTGQIICVDGGVTID